MLHDISQVHKWFHIANNHMLHIMNYILQYHYTTLLHLIFICNNPTICNNHVMYYMYKSVKNMLRLQHILNLQIQWSTRYLSILGGSSM
jgi:hypothetical protein